MLKLLLVVTLNYIQTVEKKIDDLQNEVKSLKEENRQLRVQLKSRNNSEPPSRCQGKPLRQKSLRKSNGKKSGGLKGHTGHTLK